MILYKRQIINSSLKILMVTLTLGLLVQSNFSFAQAGEVDSISLRRFLSSNDLDTLQYALRGIRKTGNASQIENCIQKIITNGIKNNARSIVHAHQMQLRDHYNKHPNDEKLAHVLLSMGDFYLEEEIPERALICYKESNELSRNNQKPPLLLRLSNSHLMMEQLDSALIYRNQILEYQKTNGLKWDALATKKEIVSLLQKAGKHEAALKYNIQIKDSLEPHGESASLAIAHNNIGYNYNLLKDYKAALNHFQIVKKMNKKNKFIDQGELFTNMGIVYSNLGDLNNAIDYLSKAEKKIDKKTKPQALANLFHLTSTIYYINGDIHNALLYSNRSSELAKKINDSNLLQENYLSIANIYQDLYEFDKAFEFQQKHLYIKDSTLLEERSLAQSRVQNQNQIEKSEKEIKLLLADQEVQSLLINQLKLESEKLNLASDKLKLEATSRASELELLRKEQEVQDAVLENQILSAEKTKQELALAEQKLITQKAGQRLLASQQKEELFQAELKVNQALKKEREKEIALLTKDKELLTKKQKIDQLQLAQEASFRNTAYSVGSLLGLMLLMFLGGLLNSRRINKKLGKQKTEIEKQRDQIESSKNLIEQEKNKSESLLLNILPKQTAAELKAQGFSKPKHYNQVSVLFSDFSNFTSLSEGLNAEELLKIVNLHFSAFDAICEKYNIEKIKTIGDAYMCASGLPIENKTHAKDIVFAAIEMQTFVKNNNKKRQAQNLKPWKMRLGIHTGPIIAGVVGSKKFSYDIWGDTVNTASRIESSGDLDQINISSTTYNLIKDDFKCRTRGKIKAKNKGELEMYFVEF